jgi:prophage tail gpP-like protein
MIPCDGWQVTVGLPGPRPGWLQPWADVRVTLNDDPVLCGRVDAVDLRTAFGHRELTLRGRDMMAALVDCSAPIYFGLDMTLAEIVEKLVKPLGIEKIDIQADAAALRTVKNKHKGKGKSSGGKSRKSKASVQPGMKVWDALQEACEAAGVWPWCDPDGTLVIGGPDYNAPPVADLILTYDGKDANVIDLKISRDISRQYSQVTVLGQSPGTAGDWASAQGKNAQRAAAADPTLQAAKVNRPLVVVDSNCSGQDEAERKAKKLLADGQLASLTITAKVRGHRTEDGLLWTPGQRLHLISEPDGIDKIYFLTARDFVCARDGGQTTELTLKPDNTWLPELTKQSRGGKGGGGKTIIVESWVQEEEKPPEMSDWIGLPIDYNS